MLFSFEQFATLNRWLGGLWRLILLNLMWTAVTLLGLGILGVGPASYALAAYLDGWMRDGRTPPEIGRASCRGSEGCAEGEGAVGAPGPERLEAGNPQHAGHGPTARWSAAAGGTV